MYVDDCRYDFAELASQVLPDHMDRLRTAMTTPWPLTLFARAGYGRAAIARELGLVSDFSGCYVLLDGSEPKYVGISRGVISRLRQHVTGRTHFDASLAYAIAQRRCPTAGPRSGVMQQPAFGRAFADAKRYLQSLTAAVVAIDNPLELHVFEAYAALTLKTFEWNTFRTH
jgi:hypothetical protein